MITLPTQTFTYLHDNLPSKDQLLKEFKGQPLDALRTPAIVIDRAIFANNCARMHESAKAWNADFRAHVKTHKQKEKTAEGTRLQLVSTAGQTSAVVVSTLMEGWEIIRGGLVADGTVKDILYGLPVAPNKLADLAKMSDELTSHDGIVRLIIDNKEQVSALELFNSENNRRLLWSVFVKVDVGGRRAGLPPDSTKFKELLLTLFASPAVSVHGFYCHASQSYASTSLPQASGFLSLEVQTVNNAAKVAQEVLRLEFNSTCTSNHTQPFVLSVGATPTAHASAAANLTTAEAVAKQTSELCGKLELHAGNYPVLDLQQIHTSLVGEDRVAHRILATVVSYYEGRGKDGGDEAMCDAGAIAMSKDTGPSGGFGDVVGRKWKLGRVSQEHGVLVQTGPAEEDEEEKRLKIGSVVQVISQHVCLTAANHPWYYIVDSGAEDGGNKVVDIWVPWKGW